ncbi:MAG: hypothetical protein HY922_04075 [Elusimicrobia bacterium]|nr:hypothetical protein [Elusimicrobiota bacterium]
MRTVPRDSSPLLHEPVYDCSSDEFELPCEHDSFDGIGGRNARRIGWLRSPEELEQMLKDFSGRAGADAAGNESIAFVDGGDYLLLVSVAASLLEPGGLAYRIVKTGPSEWFVWYWRAGMRRIPEDPPFLVYELAANPSLWAQREAQARRAIEANGEYRSAARRCGHK